MYENYVELCAEIKLLMESRSNVQPINARTEQIIAERIIKLRKEAIGGLARERGWKRSKLFSLRMLRERAPCRNQEDSNGSNPHQLCDHGEYFKEGRKPAGIVAHLYGDVGSEKAKKEICTLAGTHGLEVEFLPESSYSPGSALGVVLTAPSGMAPAARMRVTS